MSFIRNFWPTGSSSTAPFGTAMAVAAGLTWMASAAFADTLLVVKNDAEDKVIEISSEDLDALPEIEIVTTTIWTEGVQTFTGPSLHALLSSVGVTGGHLSLTALNGYFVEMEYSDLMPEAPVLARERNGAALSIRDKGPIWLVYPYDADPMWQTEIIFSRSIWQLTDIEVSP